MGEKVFIPIAYISLTSLRYGDLETPANVVDLPTFKDNLGYIVLRGEGIKGSMRHVLPLIIGSKMKDDKLNEIIEILFGPEQTTQESGGWRGLLEFYDAYLVFVPVISYHAKIVYVTSPLMISKLASLLQNDNLGTISSELDSIINEITDAVSSSPQDNKKYLLAGDVVLHLKEYNNINSLKSFLEDLLNKNGLSDLLSDYHLLVVHDKTFQILLSRSLLIKPGIQLEGFDNEDVFRKKVKAGPWFEEEIPPFSIFVGLISISQNVELSPSNYDFNSLLEISKKIIFEKKSIKIPRDSLIDFVEQHLKIIQLGAKYTYSKGIIQTTILKNINIKYQRTQIKEVKDYNEKKKHIPKEVKLELVELIEELKDEIKENSSELKGKFSNLPERFRRLGFFPSILFYSTLKRDSRGEGYPTIIKLIDYLDSKFNLIKGRDSLAKKIFLDISNVERSDSEKILILYEKIMKYLTRIKYIIRGYAKKEKGETS